MVLEQVYGPPSNCWANYFGPRLNHNFDPVQIRSSSTTRERGESGFCWGFSDTKFGFKFCSYLSNEELLKKGRRKKKKMEVPKDQISTLLDQGLYSSAQMLVIFHFLSLSLHFNSLTLTNNQTRLLQIRDWRLESICSVIFLILFRVAFLFHRQLLMLNPVLTSSLRVWFVVLNSFAINSTVSRLSMIHLVVGLILTLVLLW